VPLSPVVLFVLANIVSSPRRLHKQYEALIGNGNVLKPRLPLVRVPWMFLQRCVYLVYGLRLLLLEDLIGDDPREHMAGDVPSRSGKGYGKREKYKGCD
jgi:hypothetical protein